MLAHPQANCKEQPSTFLFSALSPRFLVLPVGLSSERCLWPPVAVDIIHAQMWWEDGPFAWGFEDVSRVINPLPSAKGASEDRTSQTWHPASSGWERLMAVCHHTEKRVCVRVYMSGDLGHES